MGNMPWKKKMLCCNVEGSGKLWPFIMDKFEKPCCMKV
jgi:hypothetical protein